MDAAHELDLLAVARRLDLQHASRRLAGARLFGVGAAGADPPALTHLGDGIVHDLLQGPLAEVARAFDAVAVVSGAWAAPIDELAEHGGRASLHPARRRVQVTAVGAAGRPVASVVRRFADGGGADEVIIGPGPPIGRVPDALTALWLVNR
jgi:hypothetical protein